MTQHPKLDHPETFDPTENARKGVGKGHERFRVAGLASHPVTESVQKQLQAAGTNLAQCNADPIGDGDQSPVTRPEDQHVYEELFHSGGDFETLYAESLTAKTKKVGALSVFASHCVHGRHRLVSQMLERNSVRQGKSLNTMVELLERRETAMRYTPLLLVFAMLRKVGRDTMSAAAATATTTATATASSPIESHETTSTDNVQQRDDEPAVDTRSTSVPKKRSESVAMSEVEQNLVKVVSLLLLYGARPHAKDVTGRTVCFYGASAVATEASLLATAMCIGAAVSAHCFGKEIVLRDMPDASYNGKTGIAAGYQTDTGRRIVYLFGKRSEEYVRNRNMRLVVHEPAAARPPDKTYNLCNAQDRLGRVCLSELFQSTRVDVATFLLHKHEASIDIPDWNGDTLRANSLLRGNQTVKGVGEFIASEVMKRARLEQRRGQNSCSACGKTGGKECPLRVCKPCMSARYCSDDCQASHWHSEHRKECAELRTMYFDSVTIDKPSTRKGDVADNAVLTFTEGSVPMTSYRRPGRVAIGELFTVKVQRVSGRNTLLIYDKSRECEFCLGPDKKAYKKLLHKVQSELATAGTKTYMAAAFDKKGNCTFYLNQTKMKTW